MEKKLIQEIKDKMKEKNINISKLSVSTGIADSTLYDNLSLKHPMSLATYCKILEVVK
jgi:predicted transcriptional regulator